MAAKIIAVTNQKGGVGKTTTAVNLAASLGAIKRKVLLIDLDPQGNATMGSGVRKKTELNFSVADVLLNLARVQEVVRNTTVGYELLPSSPELIAAEAKLVHLEQREYFLRQVLEPIGNDYDFVLIDCPPALNILTVNALVASGSVLIPLQCEYYALEGLAALMQTIQQLQNSANPQLHIEGVLRTMYDGRTRLTLAVTEQLLQHFPDKLYKTVVPRNIRLAEAPSHGLPALLYDKNSPGALAYLALAGEIVKGNKKVNSNDIN